jgi:hypothetical protein
MLRSSSSALGVVLRRQGRLVYQRPYQAASAVSSLSSPAAFQRIIIGPTALRTLSSKADNQKSDDETKEIVLTPGEKVAAAGKLTMWGGIFVFAGICAYYIGKELIPT